MDTLVREPEQLGRVAVREAGVDERLGGVAGGSGRLGLGASRPLAATPGAVGRSAGRCGQLHLELDRDAVPVDVRVLLAGVHEADLEPERDRVPEVHRARVRVRPEAPLDDQLFNWARRRSVLARSRYASTSATASSSFPGMRCP